MGLLELISGLTSTQMTEGKALIRGESHSVTEALHRQMSHYAYHVGQIVLLARNMVGSECKTLSIPCGESQTFNTNPSTYLHSPSEGDEPAADG